MIALVMARDMMSLLKKGTNYSVGTGSVGGVSVATGFDTGEGAGDVQPRQQQHRHTARGYGCRTGHMDAGIGRSLYRPHEYTGIEVGIYQSVQYRR